MSTLSFVLVDSAALADAADTAGISLSQARKFAAALGELPAQQAARVLGEAARLERCGKQRATAKEFPR